LSLHCGLADKVGDGNGDQWVDARIQVK
jgi:hypothetical protein